MSKPHFTKAEAIPLLQAAYKEGRLSAQRKDIEPGDIPCQYRDDSGCPCAIGLLIDTETAAVWDEGASMNVDEIFADGLATSDDNDFFLVVQDAHDQWLTHGADDIRPGRSKPNEQLFREAIGL